LRGICYCASCQETGRRHQAAPGLASDLANYPGHSGKFMIKLLRAWMAMGFRRPAIEDVA